MSRDGSSLPTVTVILPTLNEREYIRDCLDSLLAQDYSSIVEVLVVDGGSNDGTRAIVTSSEEPIRLIDNPRVTAAAAMNVGLAEARGDIVCRADAHTIYATDYVTRCVEVLDETGAANVGGSMRPVGTNSFGRAVAAVTSSPLGVGPGKFHYAAVRSEVDTVYLGCWRRQLLLDVGGYDEGRLQWAAEDQELNFRIRRRGGSIVLDPSIRSWYFPRQSAKGLRRQYFNYGVAKASTLAKHATLPTWRPLAPAALAASSLGAALLLHGPRRVALPVAHGLACAAAAVRLARDPGVAPHRAFAVLEICHWSYGAGFWAGVARALRGRPFDTRPRGHR